MSATTEPWLWCFGDIGTPDKWEIRAGTDSNKFAFVVLPKKQAKTNDLISYFYIWEEIYNINYFKYETHWACRE